MKDLPEGPESATGGPYRYLQVESHDEGRIARILLDRPHTRNAQNRGMLVELDQAFLAAEADDDVRVVILGGIGPHFSSGHDLGSAEQVIERSPGPNQHPSFRTNGASRAGTEARTLQEWHYYFQNALRWRNLRKITVAQVQGRVMAGSLIPMWACDLIVAADDTQFAMLGGARFGVAGGEFFAQPWELGVRRAKELMLTGDFIGADEAYRIGMVSKVFPRDELTDKALQFARRIAELPTMASLLIKESVNQTVDRMGFSNSLHSGFNVHQLSHSHWAALHDDRYPLARPADGGVHWKDAPPLIEAGKDRVGA